MDRRNVTVIFTCLLACLAGAPAVASSVTGFVWDSYSRPLAGANVTFTCPTLSPINATSDQYGRYRANGLPDVTWCSLTVTYDKKSSAAIRINTGSGSKDINVKLQPSESGWTITL